MASSLTTALADRYRIEGEIGSGGMATVYLAQDLKHDRKVAVKVLKPELAAVLGAERFLTEIKTTANLQHPHILPLFDSGEADGFLFYVMPFIDGETLREKLDREKQLYQILWDEFSGAIRVLIDNRYVYQPFWDFHNGKPGAEDWQETFERSRSAAHQNIHGG